jgi:peptide/nickel transport system substrate-binding protein
LKSGITFSDGEAFDATAMKWNLDRAIALDGQPGFLLADVVESVVVVDSMTLKINLQAPDATFLQRLSYTVAWPVSPESLPSDSFGGDPTSIPAGLGPYVVSSWTKDTELILEKNPTYFGDAPKTDKIIVKFYSDASALLTALESGEVDVAQKQFGPDEIGAIKANSDVKYVEKATAGIRYLVINVDDITEKAVRNSMALAIDRGSIVSTVYDNLNEPIYTMVPKIFTASVDTFEDGPNQAEITTLMEGAGYSTTNKFAHDLWYTPDHYGSDENVVAQLLKEQLEDTGFFTITLKNAEWSTYRGQFKTMGFFLLGWWFDYPDPSNYIDPFVGSGAVSLGSNYSDSAMDGYIDTMLTDTSAANRAQAVKDAQELMAEDAPVIPLFSMVKQFSAMQKNVQGFTLEPSETVHYNSITVSSDSSDSPIGLWVFTAITLSSLAWVTRLRWRKN